MADKQVYTFTNEIDEVEICSLGAKIIVVSTDEAAVTAEYDNPADRPELCAVLCGKRLTLKETLGIKNFFCRPAGDYMITVRLPKKVYSRLKISTASGGAQISDSDLTAERFSLSTASGEININAYFENVKIKTASGSVTLGSPIEKTAKSVEISAASGNIGIEGYKAEKYSISSISGKTTYKDAAGAGSIHVTSGKVNVAYAEWSDDLKISAVSGCVNITLPENSGAKIKFDGVSGTVKTDLGSTDGSFITLGKGTNGEFGGSNKHELTVNLVSGTVTVSKGGGIPDEEDSEDNGEMTAEFVSEKAE